MPFSLISNCGFAVCTDAGIYNMYVIVDGFEIWVKILSYFLGFYDHGKKSRKARQKGKLYHFKCPFAKQINDDRSSFLLKDLVIIMW